MLLSTTTGAGAAAFTSKGNRADIDIALWPLQVRNSVNTNRQIIPAFSKMNTFDRVFADFRHFNKEANFYDFLFTFRHTNSFQKKEVNSKKKNICFKEKRILCF